MTYEDDEAVEKIRAAALAPVTRIGIDVDATIAAKDAEIERLRAAGKALLEHANECDDAAVKAEARCAELQLLVDILKRNPPK